MKLGFGRNIAIELKNPSEKFRINTSSYLFMTIVLLAKRNPDPTVNKKICNGNIGKINKIDKIAPNSNNNNNIII